MRKLFLYCVLILSCALLFSVSQGHSQLVTDQSIVPDIVKSSPSADRYPTADAVVLLDEKTITREADGTVRTRIHHIVKIFTQMGIRDFGDRRILYNDEGELLNIITARTYMADGTVVPVPKNGFNLLTPQATTPAPAYKNIKEMAISFTALEKNAIIELEAEIVSKPHFLPFLSGYEYFGSAVPVIKKVFGIAVSAEDSLLLYRSTYGCPGPFLKEESGKKYYTWVMNNVPYVPQEPLSPPIEEQTPQLWYSTIPSWDNIVPALREGFSNASSFASEVMDKAKNLTRDKSSSIMQIEAIHKYVVDDIVAVPVLPRLLGHVLQPAGVTFSQGAGNFADKAALLYGMLKSAGFSARIALATERQIPDAAPPVAEIFSKIYVIVQNEGKEIWLDPVQELKPTNIALRNQTALIIADTSYEWRRFPSYGPQDNSADVTIDLSLETYRGTAHVVLKGAYDPFYSLRSEEGKKSYCRQILKQLFPKIVILNANAVQLDDDDAVFETAFTFEDVLNPVDSYERYLIGSHFLYPALFDIPMVPAKRVTPLQLPSPFTESVTMNIITPKNWEIAAVPEDFETKSKSCSYVSHIQKEAGKVRWSWQTIVPERSLNPGEYNELRSIIASQNAESQRSLFFTTK